MEDQSIRCRVCGGDAPFFARAVIIRRHDVAYYRCADCNAIQTEQPYWLGDAYATALAAADVGAVQRNLQLADQAAALIPLCADAAGRFLDYGGGHGLFVRLMRDRGFDFRWTDQHATNDYAMGFESAHEERGFSLITAFEVAEHLTDPGMTFRALLERGDSILFSTELVPEPPPLPGEWWYYVLSSGQHVTLYSRATLAVMARQLGVHCVSNGRNLHLLTRHEVSRLAFSLLSRVRVARALSRTRRRKSLQPADFARFSGS